MVVKLKSNLRNYVGFIADFTEEGNIPINESFEGNSKEFKKYISGKYGVKPSRVFIDSYRSGVELYEIDPQVIREHGTKIEMEVEE